MTPVSEQVKLESARELAHKAYLAATRVDQPLHTVTRFRPAHLELDDLFHGTRQGAGLSVKVLDARRAGSRFLSDEEWAELKAVKPFWPEPDLLEQIELLREPWRGSLPQGEPHIVLVDAAIYKRLDAPEPVGTLLRSRERSRKPFLGDLTSPSSPIRGVRHCLTRYSR